MAEVYFSPFQMNDFKKFLGQAQKCNCKSQIAFSLIPTWFLELFLMASYIFKDLCSQPTLQIVVVQLLSHV